MNFIEAVNFCRGNVGMMVAADKPELLTGMTVHMFNSDGAIQFILLDNDGEGGVLVEDWPEVAPTALFDLVNSKWIGEGK